jgi:hypothetical protein
MDWSYVVQKLPSKASFWRNIKGEMGVTIWWGRRYKKLLDDLKERRGYSHLKEEALVRTVWRNRFGRGFGPVVRQNTQRMGVCMLFNVLFLNNTVSSVYTLIWYIWFNGFVADHQERICLGNYWFIRELGSGTFGYVMLAKNECTCGCSLSGELCAVKVVHHERVSPVEKDVLIRTFGNPFIVQMIYYETMVSCSFKHPCLCIELFQYQDKTNNCISSYNSILCSES